MIDLKNIFENRITNDPQVRSINGLFFTVDESLEKTNYQPPYQRNYVWDDDKASYFIESIFLGTEVPPIIMFKSKDEEGIDNYEVIDGRQRYQTIIRFINGELRLKKSGLQKLGDLKEFVGKSYLDLEEKYQTLFKFTNIRTIVYKFVGSYDAEEEELVKREIFQRYNTGVTPLRPYEIDKATYFYNDLNHTLKEIIKDSVFDNKITRIFRWARLTPEQKVIKIRELLVLPRIPIKYYAIQKSKVIARYFEYISTQYGEEDIKKLITSLHEKVEILSNVEKEFSECGYCYNKFYAECVFWAMCVMDQNGIHYNISDQNSIFDLVCYLEENKSDFTTVRSSFYKVLVGRYESIARYFENVYGCSFLFSIDNSDSFRITNQMISHNTEVRPVEEIGFEELRIKKPEPVSVRIPELLDLLKSTHFLLRPSYQREEVKNRKKASSIIESMILGIMLPPIFVYKKKNGSYEVVDGQQRLLSIISYLGESYKDDTGKEQTPEMYNFKLDLGSNAILKNLKGSGYKDLTKADQNKIRSSSIYMIEIKEENNEDFDPVDLFVRLNNKPYPISVDSFEMWNSFAPRNIIEQVKQAVCDNEKWFYFRKNNTQMDNENLFTTLAYFQYMYMLNGNAKDDVAPLRTIETFIVDNRVSCRFRNRNDITKLLYEKGNKLLVEAINRVEFDFVYNLKVLLSQGSSAAISLSKGLDELLHVENAKRTQMSFYVLWLLLHDMSNSKFVENHLEIKTEIGRICDMTTSSTDSNEFKNAVKDFRKKYDGLYHCVTLGVNEIIESADPESDIENVIIFNTKPIPDDRFEAHVSISELTSKDLMYFKVKREGFRTRYVEAFLRSRLFYRLYNICRANLSTALGIKDSLPLASEETQLVFIKLLSYIDASVGLQKNYFERLLDLMFYELYFPEAFNEANVQFLHSIDNLPSIDNIEPELKKQKATEVYNEQTSSDNKMGLYLLKAIDMAVVKTVEESLNR